MTTLRIIEFETGQFAIQVRRAWKWKYCSLTEYDTLESPSSILGYCIANSLEEVEKAMEMMTALIIKARPYTLPRIKRVVRKVRL